MRTYTICGVNEHFNFPWRYAIENKLFEQEGIHLSWTESKGGTGEMTRMLRDGNTDLAVLLTEGIVQEIILHDSARIVQIHVRSPLHWGVHVHQESDIKSPSDLRGRTFAISRNGSGSHLMAIVHARKNGWNEDELNFEIVNHLEGGLKSVQNKNSEVFLWEKYTTAPFLAGHDLKYVGDVVTPWPGFVLAASINMCESHYQDLQLIGKTIASVCRSLRNDHQIAEKIAKKHHLDVAQVELWLHELEWNEDQGISKGEQTTILHGLCNAGIIKETAIPHPEKFFLE